MDPLVLSQLEKIADAGIVLLPTPQLGAHFVFERDGCVVLVERSGGGFGSIGSPGLLTERGFMALVERDGTVYFVHKSEERKALPAEAAAARRLLNDLKIALS